MVSIRKAVPAPAQRLGRRIYVEAGAHIPVQRLQPDFLLVGGQRCGTTSLFRALMQHPRIVRPSFHKGVNFFDLNYERGSRWYSAHFPSARIAQWKAHDETGAVAFEASGYYMYHPLAPERIAADRPDIKLVAMLRDPVERAYSAWKHESARGFESLDFEAALRVEDHRLAGEVDRMRQDPSYRSFEHRHHSYRRRGEYRLQLERFTSLMSRAQMHVIYSEDFFGDPVPGFLRLCKFLQVEPLPDVDVRRYNARPSSSMPKGARAELTEHYSRLRPELEEYVGHPAPWPKVTGTE